MTYVFQKFPRNSSYVLPGVYDIDIEDVSLTPEILRAFQIPQD
jgi:hypothetical protein